jgi:uncharacterized phage protein gp47/JayE
MPWQTPTLKDTRRLTRDYVLSQLGAKAMIPNSVLRIMSDSQAGLTYLTLLYLDWLALQLMPDTAEEEWLDRHGVIWLTNSDGSKGRKSATFASGTVEFEADRAMTVPVGTLLNGANAISYQTVTEAIIGSTGLGDADAVALTAGTVGNLPQGDALAVVDPPPGITGVTLSSDMTGGVDDETNEQLRERVLFRIQNPPMGGSEADYLRWATAVPGVTRAWASPEQGVGTITVRFLMDDLYPDTHGIPQEADILKVADYIDSQRPVTVMDCYVLPPLLLFYDITVTDLTKDDESTRASIEASIREMERKRSKPGQTMYRSWVDEAVSQAVGEDSHEMIFETTVMPNPGSMPILGTVTYD